MNIARRLVRVLALPAAALALAAAPACVLRAADPGAGDPGAGDPGNPGDPNAPDCNASCQEQYSAKLNECIHADGTVDQECAVRVKQEFDWGACVQDCIDHGGHVDPVDPDPGPLTCQKRCYEPYSASLQACIDAAGTVDYECVAASDVAFVECAIACGPVPGLPDLSQCAPACIQAYQNGLAGCGLNGPATPECLGANRSAFERCVSACGLSLIPLPDPCASRCDAAYQAAVAACGAVVEPNGVVDPAAAECLTKAKEAYGTCLTGCGITIPGEIGCAGECDQTLKVRLAGCNGAPDCEKLALGDYTACLEKCGLVVPPIPEPDPCVTSCDLGYKQALGACYDPATGVADGECLSRADASYLECLKGCGVDLPNPPDNPNPDCTAPCDISYKQSLEKCFQPQANGIVDVDGECAAAADSAYIACLAACGVQPAPVPGDPGFPVGACEAQCGTEIVGALFDCAAHNDGTVDAECLARVGEAFNECLAACKEKAGDQVRAALGRASNRPFIRGDVDLSGQVQITDAISLLSYLFLGGAAVACDDAADANDDGILNIADASSILGHLFLGWGALPAPAGSAGTDPTDDALGCAGN